MSDYPRTARRRVPGLRRDEVAELVGVSVDWYRWFESGRRVRVSPQLIARIAFVLQLSAYDELTMYRLALPEIYQACLRALTNTLRRQSGNDITIRVRRWIAGGRCCHKTSARARCRRDRKRLLNTTRDRGCGRACRSLRPLPKQRNDRNDLRIPAQTNKTNLHQHPNGSTLRLRFRKPNRAQNERGAHRCLS